jgi:hypothetical protein
LFTTVVTFLSKYFSSANENKNKENIDINKDGIKVNNAKYVIYFLLDFNPSVSMSFLIAFLISKKIKIKRSANKTIFRINKYCKF